MNIFDGLQQYGEKYKENKEREQKAQNVENQDDTYYWENSQEQHKGDVELNLGCWIGPLIIAAIICLIQFFEDMCFAIDGVIRAHAWSFSIFIACVFILIIIYFNTRD